MVRQVGFDPHLSRQGHLGELTSVIKQIIIVFSREQSCNNVVEMIQIIKKAKVIKKNCSLDTAEFFIDALGSLHIASCSDVIVNHASKIKLPWTKTVSQKAYDKFRYQSSTATSSLHNGIYYFKNRFKCMSSQ